MGRLSLVSAALLAALLNPSTHANELYRTSQFEARSLPSLATFGYDAMNGPLNWYGLNHSHNAACDIGKIQSPINLDPTHLGRHIRRVQGSSINVDIPNVKHAEMSNIGSTVDVVTNGTLVDGGKSFKLRQWHYHTPSEHRLAGEQMAMEQHFVFEAADETLTVIGFLMEIDTQTTEPLSKAALSRVGKVATPGSTSQTGRLNFKPLLKHLKANDVFRYTGSLTAPPCKEGVNWIVSAAPIPLDVSTYKATRKVLKFNARYTQNELGRENLLHHAARDLRSLLRKPPKHTSTSSSSSTATGGSSPVQT